jgi:cob(I)alamin adenosyltransferase
MGALVKDTTDHDRSRYDTRSRTRPRTDDLARHAAKMAKKKAARDKIMAGKEGEKGLIIVHTGAGKGKSSRFRDDPALRGAWDALGGGPVHQGRLGHRRAAPDLTTHFPDLCQFHAMGEGFTWETQDKARDIAAAQAGWEKAKELIRDPSIRLVLLDEINIALRYDYLDLAEVLEFLRAEKPPLTHVVLTGRNAKDELIEAADLVTEMTLVKHPFRSGIKAQAGVEF